MARAGITNSPLGGSKTVWRASRLYITEGGNCVAAVVPAKLGLASDAGWAAWYCSQISGRSRPRAATSMPCSFAHARTCEAETGTTRPGFCHPADAGAGSGRLGRAISPPGESGVSPITGKAKPIYLKAVSRLLCMRVSMGTRESA